MILFAALGLAAAAGALVALGGPATPRTLDALAGELAVVPATSSLRDHVRELAGRRVAMVVPWAPGDPQREPLLPLAELFARRYRGDLEVIGVVPTTDVAAVTSACQRLGVTFPQLLGQRQAEEAGHGVMLLLPLRGGMWETVIMEQLEDREVRRVLELRGDETFDAFLATLPDARRRAVVDLTFAGAPLTGATLVQATAAAHADGPGAKDARLTYDPAVGALTLDPVAPGTYRLGLSLERDGARFVVHPHRLLGVPVTAAATTALPLEQQLTVDVVEGAPPTTVRWTSSAPADRYVLEVRQNDGRRQVKDVRVEGAATEASLSLEPGRYTALVEAFRGSERVGFGYTRLTVKR